MSDRTWLRDLRYKYPIPTLPEPAPISPCFWEFRAVLALREALGYV